jgi:hypothetical protein
MDKLVDKARFPLTTQEGLSEDKQALIDSIALDNTHEWLADGNTLKPESQARLKELEEKFKLRHGFAYGEDPKNDTKPNPAKPPELSEDDQALIDAMNLDDIREGIENGESLSESCMLRLKELEEKHRLRMEMAKANGWTPADKPNQVAAPTKSIEPQNAEYRGDPQWRLTPEESARVAKGHREMMGN